MTASLVVAVAVRLTVSLAVSGRGSPAITSTTRACATTATTAPAASTLRQRRTCDESNHRQADDETAKRGHEFGLLCER